MLLGRDHRSQWTPDTLPGAVATARRKTDSKAAGLPQTPSPRTVDIGLGPETESTGLLEGLRRKGREGVHRMPEAAAPVTAEASLSGVAPQHHCWWGQRS